MTKRASTADVYVRISQDRTGAGVKVGTQERDCRKLAAQLGLTVRRIHTDTESATTGARRRGFEDLLFGKPEAVIIWHEDRLVRTTKDLERVIELGVNVHPVKSGRLDLATPTGRAVARTIVAWAQYEGEHKSERQRSANLQRAEKGVAWTSGARLFGYTQDRTEIIESEAERVREAFATVLSGGSNRAMLRRWKTEGVISTEGNPWTSRSSADMLRRAQYAGRSVYQGVDVGPSLCPAIVDADTFAAVQVILADPSRKTTENSGRGALHLLSGIARCGVVLADGTECGAKTLSGVGVPGVSKTATERRRYLTLKCTSVRHLERRASDIEELVTDVVIGRLRRPDAAKLFRVSDVDLAPLRARAGDLRAQREALAADLDVSLDFATARDRRLRQELDTIEVEIIEASAGSALAPFAGGRDPGEVWSGLDLDARREVIRELVDVVLLSPKRGRQPFDPDSVRFDWR